MDELPPPWIALPELAPEDPATHGLAEAYVSLSWAPFWQALTPDEKAAYLDRWQASAAWREAIALRYDGEGIDWEEEAAENEAWRAAHPPKPQPWWRRW